MQRSFFPRALIALAALAASLLATGAHAACTLSVSPANIDFGSRPAASLPASDLPGWRLLGQRTGTLTGVCDTPQSQLRLRLTNVQASPTAGLLLLPARPASAAPGAMRLRLQEARAGGSAVLVSVESSSAPATTSVDVTQPASVIVLHLAQPLPANTGFSVQLNMTALLPASFTPAQLTSFAAQPAVELVN